MRRVLLLAVVAMFGCSGSLLAPLQEPKDLPAEITASNGSNFEIKEISSSPTPVSTSVPQSGKASMKIKKEEKVQAKPQKSAAVEFPHRRPLHEPFAPGERIVLQMTWLGIPAGDVVFEVLPFKMINDRKVYHIKASASSSAALNLVYKVEDSLESFVDYEGIFSHRFEMHLNETKQVRESLELLDHKKKQSFYWDRRDHKTKGFKEEKQYIDIEPFSQDSMSSLYYVRAQPKLEPGMILKFPVVTQNKTWTAEVEVVRREEIITEIGRLKTIVIKPEMRFNGVIEKKGDSFIWLTDDPYRKIVKVEAIVKIGSVYGRIKKDSR